MPLDAPVKLLDQLSENLMEWHIGLRKQLYGPLLAALTHARLRPWHISTVRLFLLLPFLYFLGSSRMLAAGFLALSIFLDTVDGALARFQKAESKEGPFIDVLLDYLTFYAVLGAVIFLNISDSLAAYYHAGAVAVLAAVRFVRKRPVLSEGGVHLALILYLVGGVNWMSGYLWAANAAMTLYFLIALPALKESLENHAHDRGGSQV